MSLLALSRFSLLTQAQVLQVFRLYTRLKPEWQLDSLRSHRPPYSPLDSTTPKHIAGNQEETILWKERVKSGTCARDEYQNLLRLRECLQWTMVCTRRATTIVKFQEPMSHFVKEKIISGDPSDLHRGLRHKLHDVAGMKVLSEYRLGFSNGRQPPTREHRSATGGRRQLSRSEYTNLLQ